MEVYNWTIALLGIPKYGVTLTLPDTSKTAVNWHFQLLPNKKIILKKHKN